MVYAFTPRSAVFDINFRCFFPSVVTRRKSRAVSRRDGQSGSDLTGGEISGYDFSYLFSPPSPSPSPVTLPPVADRNRSSLSRRCAETCYARLPPRRIWSSECRVSTPCDPCVPVAGCLATGSPHPEEAERGGMIESPVGSPFDSSASASRFARVLQTRQAARLGIGWGDRLAFR